MNINIKAAFIIIATIAFTSCIKEKTNVIPEDTHNHHHDSTDDHDHAKAGNFQIHFYNMVGDKEMELDSAWYTTPGGDSFQVSLFNYYISNIVLHKMDGTTFEEAESYHLIEQDKADSKMFTIKDVPAGHYTGVSFMIGVDKDRNTSGAQTGALDPINGMFWSWNTGYIMAKLEGKAPKSPNGEIRFHIGGFDGENSVLKTLKMDFPEHKVVDDNTMHIHFMADAKKWFHGANHIDFSTTSKAHMPGATAKMIADNYADMFSMKSHK